jgi:hypothetical protein
MTSDNAPNLNDSREKITPEVKGPEPRPTASTINDTQLDDLYERITNQAVAGAELCDQLRAVEAAIARVRHLAARIRQGAPWTANADAIAAHILATLDEPVSGPAAAEPATVKELGDAMRHARTQRDHWQHRLDQLDRQLGTPTKEQS